MPNPATKSTVVHRVHIVLLFYKAKFPLTQ